MKTWQRNTGLLIVIVLLPFLGFMLLNASLYQSAPICTDSVTKSRSCITMVPGRVVKSPVKREVSTCSGDCSNHDEYDITIAVQGGKNKVVSVGESRSDIAPGDAISIITWNGASIGVDSHNRKSYEYDWHPPLVWFLLVTSIVVLVLLGIVFLYDIYESKTSKSIAFIRAPVTLFAEMDDWIQGAFWVIVYILLVSTFLVGSFSHMLA